MTCKFLYAVAGAISFVVVGEESTYTDSKYVVSLSFGYVLFRMWGDDKPQKELYWLWFFIQPLFFGSVGAALLFKKIRVSDLGYGALCIICGVILRIIIVFLISYVKKFTIRERLFMGMAYIAKATVQSALCSVVLNDALKKKNQEFIDFGNTLQTVSIFSIILCAPTGAILLNSYGPLWLAKDVDEKQPEVEQADEEVKKID